MRGNEITVQHALAACGQIGRIAVQNALHHAFQHRRVTPHAQLVIDGGDLGRAKTRHFHRVLRRGKTFQRAFLQRVEHNDGHPATGGFPQRGHHARMVGSGIVADRKDRVGMVEILECHGALAHADRVRQAHARCFVAHVGAVGEIVAPEGARKDLKQESSLVGGAARGIEIGTIRRRQRPQGRADPRKSLVPRDRHKAVRAGIVGERMGQPPLALKGEIRPVPQLGNAMGRKKFRCHPLACGFPGDGLGAVLTKFEG